MRKDEILSKARKERVDERDKDIEIRSFKAGWIGVTIIIVLLIILRMQFDEPSYDLSLILTAQLAASCIYQFYNKRDFGLFIASIIALGGLWLNLSALLTHYGVLQ